MTDKQDVLAEALLPCPFCGNDAEYETTADPDHGCNCVHCPYCDYSLMNGPVGIGWYPTRAAAAGAWNRRRKAIAARSHESARAQPASVAIDHPSVAIGSWLSAALDDPSACDEFKRDIRAWFEAGQPTIRSASVADEWQPSLADVEAWRERNDLEGVLSHSGALTAIDDARSMHLLSPSQPETAQEGEG